MTPPPLAGGPTPSTTRTVLYRYALLWLAGFIPLVLLVHGYHPFSEDAGIYVAGVRKLIDPALYRPDAAFVLANTSLSLFAHLLAVVVRLTRIPLSYALLIAYLISIYTFLLACWSLARRIFASPAAQCSALAFASACLTMPLAGTSLMLMDPYVTSRSFSTPLGLFALVAAIDRRWIRTGLLLLFTALMHPLMAVYAAAFVLLFILIDLSHFRLAWGLSLLGVAASAAIYLATSHAPISAAYRQAVLSRSYLFPSEWAWFEYLGLAIPLLMFAFACRRLRTHTLPGKLCLAALMLGASAALSAFLFVHPSGPYFLARLQLLRGFHMLYLVGVVLLGGFVGLRLLDTLNHSRHARLTAFTLLAAAALSMFLAGRFAYRRSAHIEFPRTAPRNPWQQAFLWIRANTPADAVFAANPDLVLLPGEDGQGFRVTAERSLLADYKDEGVVVVFPWLAGQWARERNAQDGLDRLTDAKRLARLRPLGATWLLLSSSAVTSFPCPFRNAVSQVCRLVPAPK